MAIKAFYIFIGAFFACTIVSVVVVKSFVQDFAAAGKKPLFQGGFAGILAGGGGFLATWYTTHLFGIYWVFASVFLLLGMVHVAFFHKKYFIADDSNRSKVLFGEIFFMLALLFFIVVVFSSMEYFLQNKNFLYLPMICCMLAFFIPLLVYQTFEAAYKIPASEFPTWFYPIDDPIDVPDERPNEKILVIAFEICRIPSDVKRTNFRSRSPETMVLGDLYYFFLNDLNERFADSPVEYADAENNPYKWGFRVKSKWYQSSRILDPVLTMRENKIVENTIIICDRL